jgi:hypothetical protein
MKGKGALIMGGLKKRTFYSLLLVHIGLSSHKDHLATVNVKMNVRMNECCCVVLWR